LLADGYTAVHMAHCLGVSQRTVHKHLEHLYRKLDVLDRLSAVRRAEALGLVRPPALQPIQHVDTLNGSRGGGTAVRTPAYGATRSVAMG
jgi:hypothetical protein